MERIWFSTALSVSFRELKHHSPVAFPLLFLHSRLSWSWSFLYAPSSIPNKQSNQLLGNRIPKRSYTAFTIPHEISALQKLTFAPLYNPNTLFLSLRLIPSTGTHMITSLID